jgi:hypothetical protein
VLALFVPVIPAKAGIQYSIRMPKPKTSFDGHKEATQFVLIVIIALMAGLGFAATKLAVSFADEVAHLRSDAKHITSAVTQVVPEARKKDEIEETDLHFPFLERIATSTYIFMSSDEVGWEFELPIVKIFLIDMKNKTMTAVHSYAQSQEIRDVKTLRLLGDVLEMKFGFFGPRSVKDYYSLSDGQFLFSALYEPSGVFKLGRGKKEVKITLDYSCSLFDEEMPEQQVTTGTAYGIYVNDKKVLFEQPRKIECDVVGGEGIPPVDLLVPATHAFHFNAQTHHVLFQLITGDHVQVATDEENFGKVDVFPDVE